MSTKGEGQHNRLGALLLHGGFALTGMVTTMLATLLPFFTTRWTLSDAAVGYVFPAQFIGSKLGNLYLLGFGHHSKFQRALVLGYGLICAGVGALIVATTWPTAIVAVFCYNAGIGIVTPATNIWVSESNPGSRAAALNVLKFVWSVGAVFGPVVFVSLHRLSSAWGVSFFLVVLSMWAAVESFCSAYPGGALADPLWTKNGTIERRAIHVPTLVCVSLLFFVYLGVESSVAWWVSSLALRIDPRNSHWILAPSFFWGGLMAGRAIAPWTLRRFTEHSVVISNLALAMLGTTILIYARNVPLLHLGSSLAGLGLASIYPILIAFATKNFSFRVATAMFLFSGSGGAAMPWVVGIVSTLTGSLHAGLFVPLGGVFFLLGLVLVLVKESEIA